MIAKRFFKTKNEAELTFAVESEPNFEGVSLVSELNDWQPLPMQHTRDGQWRLRVRVPLDRRIQFRYLATGGVWLDDNTADDLVPNDRGGHNCVVHTFRGHSVSEPVL